MRNETSLTRKLPSTLFLHHLSPDVTWLLLPGSVLGKAVTHYQESTAQVYFAQRQIPMQIGLSLVVKSRGLAGASELVFRRLSRRFILPRTIKVTHKTSIAAFISLHACYHCHPEE